MIIMGFRDDFIWGAASSAYQIEGHSSADGGGPSIWDTFSHIPGKIFEDNNGDIACDSYHRWEEDIRHLKELGVSAYRFSTSWARIDPKGDGNWNPQGLAYYSKLVDSLLEAGITPWMTLYHWELPQALEDKGGWEHPDTAAAFGRFAGMMARHFKGRVTHYITLNEPQCSVGLGYEAGIHAPGKQLSLSGQFACWKHLLMAHGLASRAIRSADSNAEIGFASTGNLCYPLAETEQDIAAARKATFTASDEHWTFTHHMALDPICKGKFPACGSGELQKLIDRVTEDERNVIHAVPDFLCYNIYNGWGIQANENGDPIYARRYDGFPRTALKWPVTPEVMDWGMRYLYERYPLPCSISENGLSCNDKIYLDGKVHDPDRIDFLHRYLLALRRAAEHGVDLRGYFHWSLTDNFEWHSGYGERFGLIFVNYPTQDRILKDSFHWYSSVIASNGSSL